MSKKNRTANQADRATKVEALRAAERRKARRTKTLTYAAAGLVVAAIGVGTTLGINAQHAVSTATIPAHVDKDTLAFTVAADTPAAGSQVTAPPVKVDIYEDFQCPACGRFESTAGPLVEQLVNSGEIVANYRIMSFLGVESDRAASAAGCAADAGKFFAFHKQLYARQPAEGTGGYTTADLTAAGKVIGLTGKTFTQCVTDQAYAKFASRVDTQAAKDGVNQTPTIFINGKKFTYDGNPVSFIDAVHAAQKDTTAAGPDAGQGTSKDGKKHATGSGR